MGNLEVGVEPHAGINAFAIADSGEAGAIAEVGKNHLACCRWVAEADQFFHQVVIGQAVKTIASHAQRPKRRGMGSSCATRGMLVWNAVSKQATCGRRENVPATPRSTPARGTDVLVRSD